MKENSASRVFGKSIFRKAAPGRDSFDGQTFPNSAATFVADRADCTFCLYSSVGRPQNGDFSHGAARFEKFEKWKKRVGAEEAPAAQKALKPL